MKSTVKRRNFDGAF